MSADSLQESLLKDRYAQAALSASVNGQRLQQPQLLELAWHLHDMNTKRVVEKGKPMSDDHLKQEAVRWAKDWMTGNVPSKNIDRL